MAPKKGRGRRGAARPLNETQTSLLKKMVGVSVLCSLSAGALWLVARRAPDRSSAAPRGPAEAPVLDWSTDEERWPDSVAVGAALSVEECGRVLRDLETVDFFESDDGVIVGRNRDVFDAEEGEDYGYRRSEFKWVPTGAEPGAEKFDWLHKKIHEMVTATNDRHWRIPNIRMGERLQVARYTSGGHYSWVSAAALLEGFLKPERLNKERLHSTTTTR